MTDEPNAGAPAPTAGTADAAPAPPADIAGLSTEQRRAELETLKTYFRAPDRGTTAHDEKVTRWNALNAAERQAEAATADDAEQAARAAETAKAREAGAGYLTDPARYRTILQSVDGGIADVLAGGPSDAGREALAEFQSGVERAGDLMARAGLDDGEARQVVRAYDAAFAAFQSGKTEDVFSLETGRDACQAMWKDAYPQKLAAAQRALLKIDRDGSLAVFLEDSGLGNDPNVLRIMADVAARNGW